MGRQLTHMLSPACHFLAALGVRNIARQLGLDASTVSNWNRPADPTGHNNSTGGYIPPEHWPALLDMAADLGLRHLTIDLLRSKPARETLPMANRERLKGDRFEYEMVHRLEDMGFECRRVPGSGSAEGDPGDLKIRLAPGEFEFLGQCKISKKGDGYVRVMHLLDEVAIGALEAGRKRIAVMHLDRWLRFVRNELVVINWPTLTGDFTTLRKALEGHDVLFFRRDRGAPYVAMRM